MNVALYVRVSTQEQRDHGYSIENQLEALQTYSEQHGYTIYKIYNDAGISAHVSYKKRPALLQLIADCRNKKIDLILFTRIDRWFRSVKDYYLVMEQIGGVPWLAIWEDYETQTSAGQLKVNIMLSISEAEAARTGEKIKSVLDSKTAKGEVVTGSAPTGYLRRDRKLIKDPEKQAGVQAFFDSYNLNHSPAEARRAAAEHGVAIHRSVATKMLRSDKYWKLPDPYTTEQAWSVAQSILNGHSRETEQGITYLFSGLMWCKCGHAMSSKYNLAQGIKYPSYRCTGRREGTGCTCPNVSERRVEQMLLAEIKAEMDKQAIPKHSQERTKSKDIAKEIQKYRKRLERVGIRFEDGDISVREYKKKRAEILEKINALSEAPETHSLTLPDTWEELYHGLSKVGQRAFWQGIISKIVWDGEKIQVEFR